MIQFQDGEGHVQDGNKIVSAEHASDELKAYRERKAAVADQQLAEQLAAAVDEFRGVPQQPEVQPTQRPDWAPEPQPEYAPAAPNFELDNLLQDLPAERRAPFVEAYNQHLQNAQTQAEAQYNRVIRRRRTMRSSTSRALPKPWRSPRQVPLRRSLNWPVHRPGNDKLYWITSAELIRSDIRPSKRTSRK